MTRPLRAESPPAPAIRCPRLVAAATARQEARTSNGLCALGQVDPPFRSAQSWAVSNHRYKGLV